MVRIGTFELEGPYSDVDSLEDLPGVFAIQRRFGAAAELLLVGDSESVKTEVASQLAVLDTAGAVSFAVLYTPQMTEPSRRHLASAVRRSQHSKRRHAR